MNTIVITTEIESGFVAKDDLIPFRCSPVSSCTAPLQTEASMAKRLGMVREDTGAPNEGATCVWMAAYEAVGCMRIFLTMWRSSRRLVCQAWSSCKGHLSDPLVPSPPHDRIRAA
ncbi:hypothetical protein TNCV_514991 [Trichonephila clavipes]|nr:hypothetical protein TNCV_514991 [Trichonephila clavipes]